jgi:hypothetical protein
VTDGMLDSHPSEERLVAYALGESNGTIEEHVRQCRVCAEYVKDVQAVRGDLSAVADEDVPSYLRERILAYPKRRSFLGLVPFWMRPGEWYRNPVVVGLGVVLAAAFLYLFFLLLL